MEAFQNVKMPVPGASFTFTLCGFGFALNSASAAAMSAAEELVGHLVGDNGAVDRILEFSDVHASIGPFTSDSLLSESSDFAGWIKMVVLQTLLARFPSWMALHCGALSGPDGGVLLAGSSGSGKTTLGTLLNASGFACIGEDVVFVRNNSRFVRGLPFSYCCKEESWTVVRVHRPDVDCKLPHLRLDGKTVKYLTPCSVATETTIDLIVFPRFTSDSLLALRQVAKSEAILLLLNEALNSNHRLTCAGFLTLCSVVDRAETVEICYGEAIDACCVIEKLLNCQVSKC